MTSLDVDGFRTRLEEERKRVLDAIDNIHHENPRAMVDETQDPGSVDNHPGDIATVTFDREMASTLEEHSTHVLAEIDGALARIEDGTFGTCLRCGKPIGTERLEALPWATLCIDDKRREERQ
jgi:RNA polymerase-binding protein DksA